MKRGIIIISLLVVALFSINAFVSVFDNIYIQDNATKITKDGSNNISFTDAVTGTKTLADLTGGSLTKTITVENPAADDNIAIFYTPVALTITEIRGVIVGATSVSLRIKSGTRSAIATTHNSSVLVVSSTTTGTTASISNAAIAAGSWVVLEGGGLSGTPTQLSVTITYTVD